MGRLIELDAALEGLENLNAISFYWANEHSNEAYAETKDMLEALPTVDAVPTGVYKQVRWERDIAIQQLDTLGYGLGEKVIPVVRCKDCKHWRDTDHTCREHSLVSPMTAEDFCSKGERKDGDNGTD